MRDWIEGWIRKNTAKNQLETMKTDAQNVWLKAGNIRRVQCRLPRWRERLTMMRGSDVSRTGQIGLEGIKPQKVGELSRERSSRSKSIGRRHLGLGNERQRELKAVAKLLQETLLTTMER